MAASTTLLLGSRVLSSCKKDDPVPDVDDYIDKAALQKLNAEVLAATTIASLPASIQTAGASANTFIPAAEIVTYSTVDLTPVIQAYKASVVISASERTKLEANHAETLSLVLNRMLKLPSFASESSVSTSTNAMSGNASLSPYLTKNTPGTEDMYAGSYYKCALDVQQFMIAYTIPQLEKIAALKTTGTKSASVVGTKSASVVAAPADLTPAEQGVIALLMVLVLAQLLDLINVVAELREKLQTLHIGG